MRVALVHYWLTGYRGGERVLAALAALFPKADIYTHIYAPKALPKDFLAGHKINTSYINRLPFAHKNHQAYVPFMPAACASFDLRGYDLVISSEAGPAKGVITDPDCLHLCYCHSPMRYLWDQRQIYYAQANWPTRFAMHGFGQRLRNWDTISAARVDHFIANSHFVAKRIAKTYRRQAQVIYPPLDLELFHPSKITQRKGYLFVGQLEAYKRPDLALAACAALDLPLTIVGTGRMYKSLQKQAGPKVRFLDKLTPAQLRQEYCKAKALLFPGVEDLGLTALEAQACATPVIAFGKGGQVETILNAKTGVLFAEQSLNALRDALTQFEQQPLQTDVNVFMTHVKRFSTQAFNANIQHAVDTALKQQAYDDCAA